MLLSTFECSTCGTELYDELPPYHHFEAWPCCCGEPAHLLEPHPVLMMIGCRLEGLNAEEGGILSDVPSKGHGLPFPGADDTTSSGGWTEA